MLLLLTPIIINAIATTIITGTFTVKAKRIKVKFQGTLN